MEMSDVLKGAAALQEMLDLIGETDDKNVIKVFCDNEMVLRQLLKYTLKHIAQES